MRRVRLPIAFRTVLDLLANVVRLGFLMLHSHTQLTAENLFLRKQLALYLERRVKPRRADDATRIMLVALSRFVDWRQLLVIVKPDTLIRWHRKQERRPAMEYGAIDLHKKDSQIRIVTEAGHVIDQRVLTTRQRFTEVFWGRPRMRILVEASTESEWVAQHLEQLGHEVVVADPNYGLMYGHRSRRVKTDRRDVVALLDACQQGTSREAHRRSARQQEVQCWLNVRQELSAARPRAISLTRSITRAAGLRLRGGRTETFPTRLNALEMSMAMKKTLSPRCSLLTLLETELATADAQFETLVASDPVVKRLHRPLCPCSSVRSSSWRDKRAYSCGRV